ncbi:MAG: sigma-54 dependent transcriptional regulator [Nitrospirae bacterium]|jgi:DNA-binding NtrC family response regulator|nr:sigma-54 dependent transcriptional regulator [Nitrospirota bacterium]MCL5062509.1 sigma-54 dependent transcriptional regulator [Nitrospirota bacterium]MDA8214964.1 sigma-54 dependent transcriptional regulator [Nitrospiraceae bacterium]MDA8337884.1 sigma-54 dependent transcriptional regulator [Nitrospiraceae bacterium]
MNKVLIVDDDKIIRLSLKEILEDNGFSSMEAFSGRQAIELFKKEIPDAVLLDLKMPGMDGIETMQELKKIDADVPVIIVTAHVDLDAAVGAIKLGAYDFIVKPPKFDRLLLTLKRAIEKMQLEKAVKRLNTAVGASLEWLLGKSEVMKGITEQIEQVASSDFSVIIQGETGTGKTTIANIIHNLSKRANSPFVTVDIGAIPESLVESELFGHERGAFTGADKKKKGFFEVANGGTILIDEVQNISPYIQGKLLRAVEEKKIYPLGNTQPVDIDVRIIAATNTDIRQAVREKKIREDMFFRLSEFIINLPTLRERIDDIPFLAQRFLVEACAEINKQVYEISDDAVNLLVHYPWPGNVRELKNVIRRAALVSSEGVIKAEHLSFIIGDKSDDRNGIPLMPLKELVAIAVRDVEKKAIKQALEATKGNKTKAASILQIDYKTLLTKIKECNIQ